MNAADIPPIAKVGREPYTQFPRDLYIPPDAVEVFLEAFEGPLDLLLYLITVSYTHLDVYKRQIL